MRCHVVPLMPARGAFTKRACVPIDPSLILLRQCYRIPHKHSLTRSHPSFAATEVAQSRFSRSSARRGKADVMRPQCSGLRRANESRCSCCERQGPSVRKSECVEHQMTIALRVYLLRSRVSRQDAHGTAFTVGSSRVIRCVCHRHPRAPLFGQPAMMCGAERTDKAREACWTRKKAQYYMTLPW